MSFDSAYLADFWVKENQGVARCAEPVSVGVPIPDCTCTPGEWAVLDENGRRQECHVEVLTLWPSGAPKWVLVSLFVDVAPHGERRLRLVTTAGDKDAAKRATTRSESSIQIGSDSLFSLRLRDDDDLAHISATLEVVGKDGRRRPWRLSKSKILSAGPFSESLILEGQVGRRRQLAFTAHVTTYRCSPLLRIQLSLHNPRRTEHLHGFWDLGDPQSELLRRITLSIATRFSGDRSIHWKENAGQETKQTKATRWILRQESSGGVNWNSRTHRDAHGKIPWDLCGYEVLHDETRLLGKRACPIVGLSSDNSCLCVGMQDFWQKCPSAMQVEDSHMRVDLLAEMRNGFHELQAGEKITRTVWLRASHAPFDPSILEWMYHPLTAAPTQECVARSRCLEWQSPNPEPAGSPACELTKEMLQGPRNFFWKREASDEYGWRNYGDIWADHEEVFADSPKPVISHYNNQYDILNGLLRQFIATRDHRWWELASPLAQHVLDIDIYQTEKDRAGYNGGMFWHTAHYLDAGISTHRGYSREMLGGRYAINGGGPSNEHNYTSGLLLYHLLTGDQRARSAVLSLANWVEAMDDGTQHMLAPFNRARTGHASSTSFTAYHGPGRGAGNSINALVDAWQLTRDNRYLDKCHELIYRTIHPEDDVAARDLSNAESRWSYTVYLQSLVRYDVIVGAAEPTMRTYIRASLVRYGRWMVQNEELYLDHPERLQYPTETWAAQDLRKGITLMLIANYVDADEGEAMFARGHTLLKGAREQLMAHPTRCFTRPAAIVLQQLPIEYFLRDVAPQPGQANETIEWSEATWPAQTPFKSQKAQIRAQMQSATGLCTTLLLALRPHPWLRTLPHTVLGTWFRRMFSR